MKTSQSARAGQGVGGRSITWVIVLGAVSLFAFQVTISSQTGVTTRAQDPGPRQGRRGSRGAARGSHRSTERVLRGRQGRLRGSRGDRRRRGSADESRQLRRVPLAASHRRHESGRQSAGGIRQPGRRQRRRPVVPLAERAGSRSPLRQERATGRRTAACTHCSRSTAGPARRDARCLSPTSRPQCGATTSIFRIPTPTFGARP